MYSLGHMFGQEYHERILYYEFPFTLSLYEYQLMNENLRRNRNTGHYLAGKTSALSILE